jgi:hypothetical protein
MNDRDSNFLSRWSRRKAQVREGAVPPEPAAPAPMLPAVPPHTEGAHQASSVQPTRADAPAAIRTAGAAPAAPTLAEVATLSPQSDYTRFVAEGVAPEVKNAALKKLFTDPHFNVMDGLDTYIDDYGKPDPLPPGMLRKMAQAHLMGLFDDEGHPDAAAASAPAGDEAPARQAPGQGADGTPPQSAGAAAPSKATGACDPSTAP